MQRKWVEVYSSIVDERSAWVRCFVRNESNGFTLKAVQRWTGRLVTTRFVKLHWKDELDVNLRSRIVEDFINSLLSEKAQPGQAIDIDPAFGVKYPVLYAFLTCTSIRLPGGGTQPRQTASLSIYTDPHGVKAFLNDRAGQRSLPVTSATYEGVWEALEGMLACRPIPWRYLEEREDGKRSARRQKPS